MADFVNLKPRVSIQTVIQFDCPDRASFFAEYSRQLRRGEIFLEVTQKIPVGTRVDVHFQFQDCDSTVELAGEIYRHRRKLDRLEAAVQFLDPEALQKLLRLSEDDLGPLDEEVRAGKRRYRPEDDERPELRAARLAEADEQDTTKILVLESGPDQPAEQPGDAEPDSEARPGEGPQEPETDAVPDAWQRALESTAAESEQAHGVSLQRAEEEELEATKSMPSWGAHWLGLNEAQAAEANEAVPEPAPSTDDLPAEPQASAAPEQPAVEWAPEDLLEVERIAEHDDSAEPWFDLSEPQVTELLRHADPRPGYSPRAAAQPPPRREPPAATVSAPKDEIDSWLETLTPAPPRASGRIPEEDIEAGAAPVVPAPAAEPEPETILEMEEGLEPGPVVPEPDLDLDDWDWDFLQSPPKSEEPAPEAPEPTPEKDEEIFAEFMRRHVAEPATELPTEADETEPEDAEPVYFDMTGEPEPPPSVPVKTAWEELDQPWEEPAAPWDKPVPAELEESAPAAASDGVPGDDRVPSQLETNPRVFSGDSALQEWKESGSTEPEMEVPVAAAGETASGEWPEEEPFRAAPSESTDEEQEPDEELDALEAPRSGLASRIGVVAVILVLLGGTTAVVLEPAWFSSLLGGVGPEDGLSGSRLAPTASASRPARSGFIPDPLAVEATPTSALDASVASVPPTEPAASRRTRVPTAAATSAAVIRSTPTAPLPSPSSKPFVPEVIDLDPEGTKPPAATAIPTEAAAQTRPSPPPAETPTSQRLQTPVPATPVRTPASEATPPGTPADEAIALVTGVLVDASAEKVELRLKTQGKVGRILRSEAVNPPRLIFDLLETSARVPLVSKPVGHRGIERMRFGVHADKLRIVLDLSGTAPTVETEVLDGVVVLRVN